MEQVNFLDRMLKYELPFDKSNIDIVKKVLIIEQKGDKILSGKTGSSGGGWLSKVDPVNYSGKLAWFIGYVTTKEGTYIFATNIEGESGASGSKAKEITRAILGELNLL
jgi:bla regulator protein BlaR1